jgi:hypothetical protein
MTLLARPRDARSRKKWSCHFLQDLFKIYVRFKARIPECSCETTLKLTHHLPLRSLGTCLGFRQNAGTHRCSPGKVFVLFPNYAAVIATNFSRWPRGKFSSKLMFWGLRNFLCPKYQYLFLDRYTVLDG